MSELSSFSVWVPLYKPKEMKYKIPQKEDSRQNQYLKKHFHPRLQRLQGNPVWKILLSL